MSISLKRKFHFNIVNFISKNIFIVNAKVKDRVYSGNTVLFYYQVENV